jgi:hypothetical protein
VDQGLGELDALLHAGGVAADAAVALLVEPDVAQCLGRSFPGHGGGQSADASHVGDELGGDHVRRQAVVFRHVADPGADAVTVGERVQAEHADLAGRGLEQAQRQLDQRALSGAVDADQTDHPRLDGHGEIRQGGHLVVVAHFERAGLDERHGRDGTGCCLVGTSGQNPEPTP